MSHGGARPGAGRKAGSATKKTREIANKAASEGITPLDYMLSLLRDEGQELGVRLDAAKSAAPYIHPRLSTVDATIEGGLRIEIVDDLD
jgi:hypothetical protein